MATGFLILVALQLITPGLCGPEIFKNPDFESTHFSNNWRCNGCHMATSTEHYRGGRGALVTGRRGDWSGPTQDVTLSENTRYNFTGFIKLQSLAPGALYQSADMTISCSNSAGHTRYFLFGHVPLVMLGRWTMLGAIFTIPGGYGGKCTAYIQVHGHEANYFVDDMSLQQVPDIADWRTEAEMRIEQIRKADVTVTIQTVCKWGQHCFQLVQTSHEFGFGTAVDAHLIVDPGQTHYQNFVYNNFEWAVLTNALKWPQMENSKGHINYATPLNAIKALKSHGMKVRGHNVFWGSDSHVQQWVQQLSRQDLLNAMTTRINGVIGHTKGMLEHWDVNNENLHGDFYERKTGDPNITMTMFNDIHAIDRNVKLFLNDYNIIELGQSDTGLRDQALRFKDANIPIYGIGVQGHMHNGAWRLDMTAIKGRLDNVAAAGLPIWITELSVSNGNEHVKARALNDLYTLYFSHPGVEGVLLWGFWDGRISHKENALFTGSNLTPNAAGSVYQTLYHTTWRTHESHPIHGNQPLTVRGFKGGYSVNVKHNGNVIKSETFTLDKNGQSLTIHLSGNEHSPSVSQIVVG